MIWKKKGFSFEFGKNKNNWQKSHAMMPVVLELSEKLRVFYTTRHVDGRSRITYYDVNKNDPSEIIYVHNLPILDIGPVGSFDDSGTVVTFVTRFENKIYLYYNGYNVRNTVPWSNSIGLAISDDEGETFKKVYDGPIMDRLKYDSYFTITPWIIRENNLWHMWYTSGTGWIEINDRVEPTYDIKYAFSHDGINWNRDFKVAIPQRNKEESVARATIIQNQNKLYMWFIYRGSRDFRDGNDSYRIGFAHSELTNPTKWHRDDSLTGISESIKGLDEHMETYPYIINTSKDKTFMFYNGNNFGSDGILFSELIINKN